MIIKAIEIKNFLSYYNTNQFKFDEGATLIIGQNNTGKSKLFDAYNWVLYDEAYKTAAEDWASTKYWKDELANTFAKRNCALHAWVEVSVCLTFEDESSNLYIVTREYRIQKVNESEWNCSNASELHINKRENLTFNASDFNGEDARQELNRFFPKNLSRYFLFQGESISKLLRLNQRSDFTKAISELSGIKYFDRAKRYAEKVYERTKKEFDEKEDQDENVQKNKVKLTNEIDDLRSQLDDLKNKLENEYKELGIKQEKLDGKIEELSRYEECAKLLQEIKILEKQRDDKVDQRKNVFASNRSDLFTTWVYGQVKGYFGNFLRLYRQGKIDEKIPEPIRQDFIQEMLQDNICKVCGTIALTDSEQYKHIAGHLNERALDKEVAIINTLSDTADTMKVNIDQLKNDVNEFKNELHLIQDDIQKIGNKIDYKEDELRIVIERIEEEKKTKINRVDVEKVNLVQLNKDKDQIRDDLAQSKGKIDQLIGKKEIREKNLNEKEQEFRELINKSSNKIEKERMTLAADILLRANSLYNDFVGKLINDIEQETNEYFKSMTQTNPALSGTVKVDYDSREVYTVDESGIKMTNINQANKVSLQIAFVAAVLSVSNKIWENHFPFVADAPISALGGNNKLSAVKTMIEIFRQSIIILKDDAESANPESVKNDQIRQLITKNSKIRHAYELRMSGTTTNEQGTEVLKLK